MPSKQQQNTDGESLKIRSNRIFKYQQSHKSELPTPPTPSQCRQQRVTKSKIFRRTKVTGMHDNNRNLLTYGFTNMPDQPQNASNSTSHEPQLESNTETEMINKEITDNMSSIAESRRALTIEINNLLQIAGNKDNTQEALNKIIAIIQYSNDKMLTLQESTQHNLLKLLALHKDQEVANNRRDISITANSNRIQSIETKMSCNDDLHKIWITFTCDNELENLKSCSNLIGETKKILKRMEIDIEKFGFLPIRSAHFQHIKVENNMVPTLCVAFTNDKIASAVRRQIMLFNIRLEEENRLSEMRYNEKIFWSKNVWKVLKICWELRRAKLIDYVYVHVDGIRVQYSVPSNSENQQSISRRMVITNFSDIDCLRKIVNDIHSDSPCSVIYDDDYFKLKFAERDVIRSGEVFSEALDKADNLN